LSIQRNTSVVIVAAGKGQRFKSSIPKQYEKLNNTTVLEHSINAFKELPFIKDIIVVYHQDHNQHLNEIDTRGITLVNGGRNRSISVFNGIKALAEDTPEYILIHDAARPLVSSAVIMNVYTALETSKAAIPTLPVTDTIKKISNDHVEKTLDRSRLGAVQTPQGFCYDTLLKLYNEGGIDFTDESQIFEAMGIAVKTVPGDKKNFKITHPEDLAYAEFLLTQDAIKKAV
jgi:2-C-methyl-D-erythritol 4-phosphate cytidylyltransferase/2-C-methyl-D-erythritol 2,4-cyclodiphosphate synthase